MRYLLLSSLALGISIHASAQTRDGLGGDNTGILIGQTRIELSDARRIPTEPKIEIPEVSSPELTYSITLSPSKVPATIQLPEAQKMQKEKAPKFAHNYVKLGYGNNFSPLADIYITMPGKSGMLAFTYHYLGANGPGLMDFNQHRGAINGTKYFKKSNLEAGFHYNRRGLYYYGYDPELVLANKDSVRQNYQDIGGRLAWESKHSGRNKPYYRADADFYSFSDRWKQTENMLKIGALYRFEVEKNELTIDLGYQMQNFSNDSNGFTRNFVDIQPYYTLREKNWELNLGFNSTLIFEEGEAAKFKFFPRVEGVYVIEKDQLAVFGGFYGKVQKNTFRDFAAQNPFLSYNPSLDVSVHQFVMDAGLKGKITGNTGFVTKAHYARMNAMPLFINDTNELRSFLIIHDDVELIRLSAELSHQYSEKFRMAFSFNYSYYDPVIQEAAWQLPNFDSKLNMTYNMADKILLSFDAFIIGKRKAYRAFDNVKEFHTIKALGDFNLGIDYRWKKQISAFVRLNNLLGQNFQIWYAYPMYSFNMHAGVAIGF
ncbi:MAG: TonB-dependent receptor [Bacteroidia bacterium]